MFRYFGSKVSTAPLVADIAQDGFDPVTIADAFGGLGNMGVEFKRRDCKVTTCDLLSFPNSFQHARIVCKRRPRFLKVCKGLEVERVSQLIDVLNTKNQPSHWFIREYSEIRQFFTPENAKRISAAWVEIIRWNRNGWLSDSERKYVIASFLNSADACANTAGTYYAYLKNWDRKALKQFSMQWLPVESGKTAGVALQGDALECLANKTFDLLYLDPPYNNKDYSRFYHLPETLAKLKAVPVDSGSKSGQPVQRSTLGATIREAMRLPYLTKLIGTVSWKRLVVQYADGAHIPLSQFYSVLDGFGDVAVHEIPSIGYRTTKGPRQQKHHVFIVDR